MRYKELCLHAHCMATRILQVLRNTRKKAASKLQTARIYIYRASVAQRGVKPIRPILHVCIAITAYRCSLITIMQRAYRHTYQGHAYQPTGIVWESLEG